MGNFIYKNKNKNYFQIKDVIEKPKYKKLHQIMQLLEDIFFHQKYLMKLKNLNLVMVEKYTLLMQ